MRVLSKVCLFFLALPAGMPGQSLDAVIGGSQIMGSAGVQTSYQYKGTFGWTGVGYFNGGLQFGGYSNVPLRFGFASNQEPRAEKYRLGVGDQELNATFTVDEYDFYKPTARGASVFRHGATSDIQAFVGSYSNEDRQPYLRAFAQFDPNLTGAVIAHFQLPRRIELQSFNTYGDTLTSIQSFLWKPAKAWRLSAATGIGTNHPYFADALEYRKGDLALRASYVYAAQNFHRQSGNYDVEPLGFNARGEIPISRNSVLRFRHSHELITVPKYLGFKQSSSIGTVDLAGISTGFAGFRIAASVNRSSSNSYTGKNYTGTGSVTRMVLPRLRSTFSYLHSALPAQDIEVFESTSEYRVNNRLSLSHTFDRMNGSNSNTFGGRWSSNAVSLSIENQVYTSSVAAQFGQPSVFRAWNFSIRFRTPLGTTAHVNTMVDPFGKNQWGGYLTGLHYHNLSAGAQGENHVAFSKYIIRGKVVDEAGKGVWGIALQVGPEVVYSDTQGEFFLHVKNPRPVPLAVVAESSLQSAWWKLQNAPPTVHGTPEGDSGQPVVVEVQMRRTMAAK
jgi:hypothetical protein